MSATPVRLVLDSRRDRRHGEDCQQLTATKRAVELVEIAAAAASDKLASDIIAYDVSEQLVITDAFLLCSAAKESGKPAGSCSTTSTSWCTSSTPRSASTTRSSGCGRTAHSSRCLSLWA